MENEIIINNEYTVVPVSQKLVLPFADSELRLKNDNGALVNALNGSGPFLALPLKKEADLKNLNEESFFKTGALFYIKTRQTRLDFVELKIRFDQKVRVTSLRVEGNLFIAEAERAEEAEELSENEKNEMREYFMNILRDICHSVKGGEFYFNRFNAISELNTLILSSTAYVQLTDTERMGLLEADSDKERYLRFMDILLKQKEKVKLTLQINQKFSEKANKNYRQQALREQLRLIQDEIGKEEGGEKQKLSYKERIEQSDMPQYAKDLALEEADKLERTPPQSADLNVSVNWLEFVLALPWKKECSPNISLQRARDVLEKNHYGLDKVKERIVEHIAVMQLKNGSKGSMILLVGPPGTGKTSLGKSIAEALGRKYERMSLGGIRDEAEIRGHRRTYVGAMAGRILQTMKRAGATNPVIVLDEVDKLQGGNINGDPASALLEVLDPEQNGTFTDHYLDMPYDLSDVFFIATANSIDNIPQPLLDRLETIEVTGYTPLEKLHIAKEHLIEEVREEIGLTEAQFNLSDETLMALIEDYTAESGVRTLKRQIAALARKTAEKVVEEGPLTRLLITPDTLEELLGHKQQRHEKAGEDNPAGVVTGLAWTPVGGEILFIETADLPGKGDVIITGQLGDVMKESARISLSLIKARLPIGEDAFALKDIHIHVPSGAVKKDGPSAGIALFTALASLLTGIKVDPHLAMTGEITLSGRVMPIGGLREKLLAADRAGIERVLIPALNEPDLKDLPEEILSRLEVIKVSTVDDVLSSALGINLPRVDHALYPSFSQAVLQ